MIHHLAFVAFGTPEEISKFVRAVLVEQAAQQKVYVVTEEGFWL